MVEVRLDTRDPEFPRRYPVPDEVNRRLTAQGVAPLSPEHFEAQQRGEHELGFAELLGQLARHLQRHAGHDVDTLVVRRSRFASWRILVLVEHAHAEVGVAAVQLAVMVLGPQPAAFAANLGPFLEFARVRSTASVLTAAARAAGKRGIPSLFLSRPPLDTTLLGSGANTAGGVLQLGHGVRQQRVEGSVAREAASGSETIRAAESLVADRFPDPRSARIPLVAITGTNGKTTTTRMVAHILDRAGFRTGVTTSEGIRLGGRPVSEGDAASYVGHARVLSNPEVDAAVLETHHRGIVIRGFAWQHCDVGLCLNVSEDHIAPGEIETLEEMADVKAAVPTRATEAAILFADDPHCRAMAPRLQAASTWWVSLGRPARELEALGGSGEVVACTLEAVDGEEWIVIHRAGERLPLLPVTDIPATFGGAARFMVSNAMHAAAAALALNLPPEQVVNALTVFEAGEAMTPGRVNEIEGLPFRLILDFAHNPDGMARLADFTDRLEVPGRRLLALSGMAKRNDDINRKSAMAAAGHFDHYFCKEYTPSNPPPLRHVAPVMQSALVESGVNPRAISVLSYGRETLFEILSRCEPGDLLVYLIGNAEKAVISEYVDEFRQSRR